MVSMAIYSVKVSQKQHLVVNQSNTYVSGDAMHQIFGGDYRLKGLGWTLRQHRHSDFQY